MFKCNSRMAVLSAELNAALERLENIFVIKRGLNLEPNLALKVVLCNPTSVLKIFFQQ